MNAIHHIISDSVIGVGVYMIISIASRIAKSKLWEAIMKKTKQTSIINAGVVDDNYSLTTMWNLNNTIIQEISNVSRVYSSKHGMFASVPILCKGDQCHFKETCMVSQTQRIVGQRCPMEIGAIISRYEQWCAHFGIDISQDTIEEKDLVDTSLIRDLVNIEVQMLRAENVIAINGDFMETVLVDIDKKCKPYWGKDISPESQFLLTLQEKKIKILNQLNSTRKDKAKDKSMSSSPSEMAIKIFQEMNKAIKEQNIIDIDDMDFEDADIKQESKQEHIMGDLLENEKI